MKANAIELEFNSPNEIDWVMKNLNRVRVGRSFTYVNCGGTPVFAVVEIRGIHKRSFIRDFESRFIEGKKHLGSVRRDGQVEFY